jgi:hypothetical protein
MKIGIRTASEIARKYSRVSSGPAGTNVGGITISASAPASAAIRL